MKLSLPSVALGAVLVAAPAVVIRIGIVGPVQIAGVPLARDIVNINLAAIAPPPAGQGPVTLFQVPSNRWFVMTGCTPKAAGMLYERRGGSIEPKVSLDSLQQVGYSDHALVFAGGSPFPVAFAPGTVVELDGYTPNPGMTLTGYLE